VQLVKTAIEELQKRSAKSDTANASELSDIPTSPVN
jgi:hypothetical protein